MASTNSKFLLIFGIVLCFIFVFLRSAEGAPHQDQSEPGFEEAEEHFQKGMPQRRDGFSRILRSRLSRILKRGGPSSYSRIARNGFSRILRSSPVEESPEYFYEMEDPEESDYYLPAEDKRGSSSFHRILRSPGFSRISRSYSRIL